MRHNKINHSVTPCSRVLLQKLLVAEPFWKFEAARNPKAHYPVYKSLPLVLSILSKMRFNISFRLLLGLPGGFFPSVFTIRTLYPAR
jgi:hypothetical protein